MSSFDSVDDTEWDEYVGAHPEGTLYHAAVWQRVIEDAFGKETIRLITRDDTGKLNGVLPLVEQHNLLLGRHLLSMPYANYGGPLADSEDTRHALAAQAAEVLQHKNARSLELRDFQLRTYAGFEPRTDKAMMRLALPDSIDAIGKSVGAKVRSQVRRPSKEGADVAHGGAELIDEFYHVFCRTMRDLGTPVYPRRFFDTIAKHLGDCCHLVLVRLNRRAVAGAFLIGYRDVLEIPWAASIREYNRYGVNMLVYWESLKFAIERGYRLFDFGRSTVGEGTYRFKKQWGAEPHALTWHRLEANGGAGQSGKPGLAAHAIAAWQRLPLPIANWLGPRISPDLPW